MAWLGHTAIYVAGIIAAIDLIAMIALFMGFRPDRARKAIQPDQDGQRPDS